MKTRKSTAAPRALRLLLRALVSAGAVIGLGILGACGGSGNASGANGGSGLAADTTAGNGSSQAVGGAQSVPLQPVYCTLRYESSAFVSAPPGSGTDPLYTLQWHLSNTGQNGGTASQDLNVAAAWNQSRGDGVRVAIIDNSLETVHPDLSTNIVPRASYDYRSATRGINDPLPCSSADTHGTAVAGIVAAAAQDALGGSGVAPRARLVGMNALATNTDADLADALLRDVDLNSVYNSSWGSLDDGKLHPVANLHAIALERGVRTGRQGLGAIYVFAAGNGGCYRLPGESVCQVDRAGYDGYLNHPAVVAVAALDHNGRAPAYAEPGANVLVAAPGGELGAGITTTTIRGNYTSGFAGTSAAAPMVSGVAALMLAVNPSLSWRDVRLLLARSARHVDPNHGGWMPGRGTQAPYPFNPVYGFGAVDAAAAVAAAANWQSVGGSDRQLSCGPYTAAVDQPLEDAGAPLTSTIAVDPAACAISRIEFVEVEFDAEHEYSGDLQISLSSPAGGVSELARPRRCASAARSVDDCGRFAGWRFGSVRHLDEAAGGAWRLSVADAVAGRIGRINGWSLRLYGR